MVKISEKDIKMSKLLRAITDYVNSFNEYHHTSFKFDTIRAVFNKQRKVGKLKELGRWRKVSKKEIIYYKLIKRLTLKELTSVYRLDNENIYYFNYSNPPKYRKAMLIIFGITQYHKQTPDFELIDKLLSILKSIDSVDICFDTPLKPNIEELSKHFSVKQYKGTHYINQTNITTLDKITIYDKQAKNKLSSPLWRVEATISIPNPKCLALPLYEFKGALELMEVA
jgi:hypothetical protein